jgi:hypothetical protein
MVKDKLYTKCIYVYTYIHIPVDSVDLLVDSVEKLLMNVGRGGAGFMACRPVAPTIQRVPLL